MTIDPRILQLARQHLTDKQLDVWLLVHNGGYSLRATAIYFDLARSTTIDRYDSANRRLRAHGVRFTPDGRPYLEETHVA